MPQKMEMEKPQILEMNMPPILEIFHAAHSGQRVIYKKRLCRKDWTGLTGCVCRRYWTGLKQDFDR